MTAFKALDFCRETFCVGSLASSMSGTLSTKSLSYFPRVSAEWSVSVCDIDVLSKFFSVVHPQVDFSV